MEKINGFIKNYGLLIIVPMVVIMFFRTCSISSNVEKNQKVIMTKIEQIDSSNKQKLKTIENKILTDSLFVNQLSRCLYKSRVVNDNLGNNYNEAKITDELNKFK